MGKSIRVLYIDSNSSDRALICAALEAGGGHFQVTALASREEFSAQLAYGTYDIILCDCNVPGWEGWRLLDELGTQYPGLPVIVVTGSSSEERAVESMKRGAADYIAKTAHTITQIPARVEEVLKKVAMKEEQQRSYRILKESERQFRSLFEKSSDGMLLADIQTKKFYLSNPMMSRMLGYTKEELEHLSVYDLHPRDALPSVLARLEARVRGEKSFARDIPIKRKDGTVFYADISSYLFEWAGKPAVMGVFRDISDRKKAEETLKREHAFISAVLDTTGALVVVLDTQGHIVRFNRGCELATGYEFSEVQGEYLWNRLLLREEIDGVREVFNDLKAGHFPNQHENYWLTKQGGRRLISWLNTAIVDEKGDVEFIIGTGIDVTERQQKQEELERIFSLTPDMITIISGNGVFLRVNPSVREILGYTEDEFVGKSWADFIHPEDREPTIAALKSRGSGNGAVEYVNRYRAKNGTYRWLEWKTHPATADGLTYTIARDISGRKRVEETLRASEMKFRTLYESILEGFVGSDMEGRFVDANPFILAMLGYSAEELYKLRYEDITPPRWHEYEKKILQEQIHTRGYTDIYEKEYIRKDGSYIPVEMRVYLITDEKGAPTEMWAFVRDITEQKRAEENLRSAENKFRSLVEQSLAGVYIIQGSRFAYVNPKFCEIFGYPQKDIIERLQVDDMVLPEDRSLVRENLRKRLTGEVESLDYSFRGVRKDGAVRDIEVFGTYTDINGQPSVIGTLLDITERKQAEEALHKSEERFRSLVLSSSDVITIHNEQGILMYATPSVERILGYTPGELVGRNPLELVHPGDLQLVQEALEEVYQHRNTGIPTEYRFRHANGSWVNLESVANNLLHHPEIHGIILTSRDITERKHVQDQLNASYQQLRLLTARIQAVREEESTRIAREIHDELGQLLTGIKMDLSFLEELIGQADLRMQQKLVKQINSTSELVDRAIQSVRKVTTELRPAILDSLGLSAAIEWQAEEFQNRTSIRCECHTPSTQLSLDRDISTTVFRILQESLTNIARHSKATHVEISLKEHEESVVMEIADNGQGIREADLQKVNTFGILGMKERVSLLNGTFEIRGVPQRGTRIIVRIPVRT